jgi:hypothetical protein
MKKKIVLRQFINVLEEKEYRKWLVPLPAKKLLPKKNPSYVPINENDLDQSVLITHFQRWSGNRHPKQKYGASKPIMDGLGSNLFARMLAAPVRSDKVSSALLPEAVLVKLGLVSSTDGKGLLTPLLHSEKQLSKGAYVYCNCSAFDLLSRGLWRKVEGLTKSSSQSAISNPNEAYSYVWRDDSIDFYKRLLFQDLKQVAQRLKASNTKYERAPQSLEYNLSWVPSQDRDNDCLIDLTENKLTFNMSSILGPDYSSELKQILGSSTIFPSAEGLLFLRLLWKSYLFCSPANSIYSAYNSLKLEA